jgi:hypothetical protein
VADELVSGTREVPAEEIEPTEPEPEAETDSETDSEAEAEADPDSEAEPEEDQPDDETEAVASDTDPDAVDYSLFVPGPSGYELVPQTGIPPKAGQTVELVMPDRDEPTVYEVVRSGRPLPGGDVCVYLAQV